MKIITAIIIAIVLGIPTTTKEVKAVNIEMQTYTATAYSLKGRTASGEHVRSGIIAADPRVLPLGTKVHIQGMGTYIVKDTGGKIRGKRIDIWMKSKAEALRFGRRQVKLKVIK